jgi:hypothetical protein
MGIRTRGLIGAALLALTLGVAHARQCDGVSFPDRVTLHAQTLTLNGLGIRKATFFRIKVYVGALYLAHPSANAAAILAADQPSEIVLHFLWHVTTGELRDAWREGFKASAPQALAHLRGRIAELNGWMHGIGSGHTMTFVHLPGQGIEYRLDGKRVGTIPGADFARAFLGIWLGPRPPGQALKAGLLGGACR